MAELVLEMVEGADPGTQHPLAAPVELGREPAAGGIVVIDQQVSRHHARVTPAGGRAMIEDLGSRNGTYVNGQIVGTAPRELVAGDSIRMGLTVFELRSREAVARQPSAVQPSPQISRVGAGVLLPAREGELVPPPPAPAAPAAPGLRAAEDEPAFVPPAVMRQADSGGSRRSDELAALIDTRVKRQTSVAAFALLTVAALAVAIYFGAR